MTPVHVLVAVSMSVKIAANPHPQYTALFTGNQIYEYCNEKKGTFDRGLCSGYIAAISDVLSTGNHISDFAVCKPQHADLGQLFDVVMKAFREVPELRDRD